MRLVYLGLAWVLGIFLGTTYLLPWPVPALLSAGSVLLAIAFRHRKALAWAALCLALLFGGFLRAQTVSEGDALMAYRGFYELRGVVAADPDVRAQSTALRIEAKEIRGMNGEWQHVSGTALVYAPLYPELGKPRDFPYYRYGDLLQIKGMLESPQPAGEEGRFDLREYLFRQGIYSVMDSPRELTLLQTGQKPAIMEHIYRLRGKMADSLEKALPDPQCPLAEAMLLGKRGTLPSEVKTDFSQSGLSHILAISGLHVTIVAGIALAAGAWIFGRRRPTYLLAGLGVLWLYVLLSGMGAAAVRAAIMASLWLWGEWIGRPKSAFTALVFAAAVMTALDPRILNDVGFQLSFAAMGGIILLTPIFQKWGRRIRRGDEGATSGIANFILAGFSMSAGAVVATLPLIAYHFHAVSLMSLPATLVALPAVPGVIASSAAVGLAGIFSPAAADILGWIAWLFASYVIEVADLFAALPLASIEVHVSAPAIGAYYGILGALLWLRPTHLLHVRDHLNRIETVFKKTPGLVSRIPFKALVVLLLIIAALVWTAALTASDSKLHAYILDVGQGDSILIRKGNQEILIDGGPDGAKVCQGVGKALPFWDRTIELVVLTHPDNDHLTGLVEILRRYHVQRVLTSGIESNSETFATWRRLLAEKNIETVTAEKGMRIVLSDGIHITVLHPPGSDESKPEDPNESSVVLRLEYDNFRLLLPGDIGTETERDLLRGDQDLQSTVLKVAHHGSATATSAEFLNEVRPSIAVISVGRENPFGHPSEATVARLKEAVGENGLYLTSQDGTVEFTTDGKKLWVKTQR